MLKMKTGLLAAESHRNVEECQICIALPAHAFSLLTAAHTGWRGGAIIIMACLYTSTQANVSDALMWGRMTAELRWALGMCKRCLKFKRRPALSLLRVLKCDWQRRIRGEGAEVNQMWEKNKSGSSCSLLLVRYFPNFTDGWSASHFWECSSEIAVHDGQNAGCNY